ncbi:hypothetical protein PIB30_102293 [Stylosanthes scabra]|uniref:Uncharacterized protein n=1 Tax=Stylosanthes scabra TaxID=79078 RepID=A0ABU6ZWG2_9FABA|nr:hypothetical protein [Stylosanthes scabra]
MRQIRCGGLGAGRGAADGRFDPLYKVVLLIFNKFSSAREAWPQMRLFARHPAQCSLCGPRSLTVDSIAISIVPAIHFTCLPYPCYMLVGGSHDQRLKRPMAAVSGFPSIDQAKKEFKVEVEAIGPVRHKDLLRSLGILLKVLIGLFKLQHKRP